MESNSKSTQNQYRGPDGCGKSKIEEFLIRLLSHKTRASLFVSGNGQAKNSSLVLFNTGAIYACLASRMEERLNNSGHHNLAYGEIAEDRDILLKLLAETVSELVGEVDTLRFHFIQRFDLSKPFRGGAIGTSGGEHRVEVSAESETCMKLSEFIESDPEARAVARRLNLHFQQLVEKDGKTELVISTFPGLHARASVNYYICLTRATRMLLSGGQSDAGQVAARQAQLSDSLVPSKSCASLGSAAKSRIERSDEIRHVRAIEYGFLVECTDSNDHWLSIDPQARLARYPNHFTPIYPTNWTALAGNFTACPMRTVLTQAETYRDLAQQILKHLTPVLIERQRRLAEERAFLAALRKDRLRNQGTGSFSIIMLKGSGLGPLSGSIQAAVYNHLGQSASFEVYTGRHKALRSLARSALAVRIVNNR